MIFRDLVRLVFPGKCPGCGRELVRQEGAVCLDCLSEIRPTNFHRQPSDNEFYYRLGGRIPLRGASAMYYFDKKGRLKKMVEALKYRNQPGVGKYLGQIWAEQMAGVPFFEEADWIIPVPLHRSREASRGYNQATALAKGLCHQHPGKLLEGALVRKTATSSQTRKGKNERWENVRDVFEVRRPIQGHLILVDDVVTTGSTVEACLRTLLAQSPAPASVSLLALGFAHQH